MSTLTFSRSASLNPGRFGDLVSLVSREWAYWTARRDMAHLDDATLHDIGIGRSEIGDAVRHGRSARRR